MAHEAFGALRVLEERGDFVLGDLEEAIRMLEAGLKVQAAGFHRGGTAGRRREALSVRSTPAAALLAAAAPEGAFRRTGHGAARATGPSGECSCGRGGAERAANPCPPSSPGRSSDSRVLLTAEAGWASGACSCAEEAGCAVTRVSWNEPAGRPASWPSDGQSFHFCRAGRRPKQSPHLLSRPILVTLPPLPAAVPLASAHQRQSAAHQSLVMAQQARALRAMQKVDVLMAALQDLLRSVRLRRLDAETALDVPTAAAIRHALAQPAAAAAAAAGGGGSGGAMSEQHGLAGSRGRGRGGGRRGRNGSAAGPTSPAASSPPQYGGASGGGDGDGDGDGDARKTGRKARMRGGTAGGEHYQLAGRAAVKDGRFRDRGDGSALVMSCRRPELAQAVMQAAARRGAKPRNRDAGSARGGGPDAATLSPADRALAAAEAEAAISAEISRKVAAIAALGALAWSQPRTPAAAIAALPPGSVQPDPALSAQCFAVAVDTAARKLPSLDDVAAVRSVWARSADRGQEGAAVSRAGSAAPDLRASLLAAFALKDGADGGEGMGDRRAAGPPVSAVRLDAPEAGRAIARARG